MEAGLTWGAKDKMYVIQKFSSTKLTTHRISEGTSINLGEHLARGGCWIGRSISCTHLKAFDPARSGVDLGVKGRGLVGS